MPPQNEFLVTSLSRCEFDLELCVSDLELADNAAVVVLGVSRLLSTKQLERVQPLAETVELWLRFQLG